MKLDILEAHDRYKFVVQDSENKETISETCQKIIDARPFGENSFYIFAHARTIGMDEKKNYIGLSNKIPSHRLIWQPRLSRPKAQENSMLFRVNPGSDNVEIVWIIPSQILWKEFRKGNVVENSVVLESIEMFKNNKELLDKPDPRDVPEEKAREIYREIYKKNDRDKGSNFILA